MKILDKEFELKKVESWCEYLNMWLPEMQTPEMVKALIEEFPKEGGVQVPELWCNR